MIFRLDASRIAFAVGQVHDAHRTAGAPHMLQQTAGGQGDVVRMRSDDQQSRVAADQQRRDRVAFRSLRAVARRRMRNCRQKRRERDSARQSALKPAAEKVTRPRR